MEVIHVDERNTRIGENIRRFRLLRGLTQDALASGIVSVAQLSKVENGKAYIQRSHLKQFAERLSVAVERIESVDALLDELTDTLQFARDAVIAGECEKCLELVREVNDRSREFGYLSVLVEGILVEVSALRKLRDLEAIISLTKSAFEEDLPKGKGHIVRLLCEQGLAYYEYGNVSAAFDCYQRAYDAFEESSEDVEDILRIKLHYDLARCHGIMKNHRTALRFAEKAEALATEQSVYIYRLRSKYMQATFLKRLGNTTSAENLLIESLKEAKDNSLLLDTAIIHNNLGGLFQDKGNFGEASLHYEKAARLFELLKEERNLCAPLLHLAEIAIQNESLSESYNYVDKVMVLLGKIDGDTYLERANVYRVLGKINSFEGDFEAYVKHMEDALNIYVENHAVLDAYEVASELASQLDRRSDTRALSLYRRAIENVEKTLELGLRR